MDAGLVWYASGEGAQKGVVGLSQLRIPRTGQLVETEYIDDSIYAFRPTTNPRVRPKRRELRATRHLDPATTVNPRIQRTRCRLNT